MSTPRREELTRAAAALNNIGVALLTRHAYEQALATLHDAVVATKRATEGVGLDEVNTKLQLASQRLAFPEVSESEAEVMLVSDGPESTSLNSVLLLLEASHAFTALPLRIEDTDFEGNDAELLLFPIVLYNFGLSVFLQSTDRHSRKAARILSLSNQILCAYQDGSISERSFLVNILQLVALRRLLSDLGREAAASHCVNMLAQVAEDALGFPPSVFHCSCHAAAA